ncbi:EF-hand protein [Dichomitus squalens]|uniref:EF-hand protein n=1 Tax=Dichomitus squalens TaxID=114155 RepID=A0A4Q9MHF4_9APHY|nr:EF-hand protein [Dichomitus squalens]
MSRYPYGLSADITPTNSPSKLTKAQKSRARREPSGVFSLFSPPQIQQFREAFSLIDHDGDGIVGEQDLKHIFSSLGRGPSDDGGSDRGITFPMFLTMMGEHLYDFDADSELVAAFECFDEGDTGFVKCDEIRKWLGDVGERMDEHEIDKLLKGPFTRNGQFNYREWVKVLRVNTDNEESESQ